jgi:hypothetical protein
MRKITIVSAGVLALSAAAHADFVDVAFTGAGYGRMVKIFSPGHTGDAFAGQILLTLTNSTGINLDGNWIAYCTDLAQNVNEASTTYEILPLASLPMSAPMGALKAAAIEDLYAAANGMQNGTDDDFCAAFQLAIWEVVVDYSGGPAGLGDLSGGLFAATATDGNPLSAGIQNALAFLMGAIGANSGWPYLIGLGNEEWQDQIIELVPGPGAVGVGALGLLFAGRRRRR